jgi:hypothetical protein
MAKEEGNFLNKKLSVGLFVLYLLLMAGLTAWHLVPKYYTDKLGPEAAAERVVQFYSYYSYSQDKPEYFSWAAQSLCPEASGMLAYGYERDYDGNWLYGARGDEGELELLDDTLPGPGYPGSGYLADTWTEQAALVSGTWDDVDVGYKRVTLATHNARSMAGDELAATVHLRFGGEHFWQQADIGWWCIYGIEADKGMSFYSVAR